MEAYPIVKEFLSRLSERDVMQGRYVRGQVETFSEEEHIALRRMITFLEDQGYSIEMIVDIYLDFVKVSREEALYLKRTGTYRYHSVKEVEKDAYLKQSYNSYMMGMALSLYIFQLHRSCMQLYKEFIQGRKGNYLEIGPGHGEQLYVALQDSQIEKYTVVDISATSIDMTRKYISFQRNERNRDIPIEFRCEDFFAFPSNDKFDTVVMGGVMEHLEDPMKFLEKISQMCQKDTLVYVTASIDTPAKDHIYLFSGVDEVISMAKGAGFSIRKKKISTYNGCTADKAKERREPVKIAMVLQIS